MLEDPSLGMGNRDIELKYSRNHFYFTCQSRKAIDFNISLIGAHPAEKPAQQ